ncbi:MAG: hotdog fold thioesterase [Legionella sp.]|jgi:1,4-dihydroxy-2-naphthoyl-CoA hydrolase|nr:hotdog fold thioesterase [Legionella sp.]
MAIWSQPITPETLNLRGHKTMAEWLGIQFTHVGEDTLTATMPATERTKQPLGIVHGGANVVLAETIASTAANAAVDQSRYYCVGLEINANHIRSVRDGFITGVTRPVHLGRSTHIWLIDLYNDEGKLTCTSRMTASVMTRK